MTEAQFSPTADRDRRAIKWQYRVLFAALILSIPLLYLSRLLFHTLRYGMLVVCLAGFYLAVSSIKNRVTVVKRWRGIDWMVKSMPEGDRAVLFGILLLVFEIAWVVFCLTPSLSDAYFNF